MLHNPAHIPLGLIDNGRSGCCTFEFNHYKISMLIFGKKIETTDFFSIKLSIH